MDTAPPNRSTHDPIQAYYRRGEERDRLDRGAGIVEFERTKEIVLRHLQPAPCDVADIGCGPGRYAVWLGRLGHRVTARDPVGLHVEQARAATAGLDAVDVGAGDARSIDLDDGSVDIALLLGPLYHLPDREDRDRALAEARRIVRPNGLVIAAVISRWASRLHGVLAEQRYVHTPEAWDRLAEAERTGHFLPVHESAFTGYAHRPEGIRAEVAAAGLEMVELVNVEGPAMLLPDIAERMDDPVHRSIVLDSARALEHVDEVMGMGAHMLAVARRTG